MLLASKLDDSFPLTVDFLSANVAMRAFRAEEIKEREREMLQVLGFEVGFTTVHDFIEELMADVVTNGREQLDEATCETLLRLQNYALYYGMMVCHDYRMLRYA